MKIEAEDTAETMETEENMTGEEFVEQMKQLLNLEGQTGEKLPEIVYQVQSLLTLHLLKIDTGMTSEQLFELFKNNPYKNQVFFTSITKVQRQTRIARQLFEHTKRIFDLIKIISKEKTEESQKSQT